MALFHEMVGDAPETIAQYRKASQTEPLPRMGRGMTDAMLDTIRGAMAASRAAA
jgi:hypothetical protein